MSTSRLSTGKALGTRLQRMHEQLLELSPAEERIACVLYDNRDDMRRTLVNSTRSGVAIQGDEFPLQESASLAELARSDNQRVIDEIAEAVQPNRLHSAWLLQQGCRSSLTVPIYDKGAFIGFLFYDSCQPTAFTQEVQRRLALLSLLITSG